MNDTFTMWERIMQTMILLPAGCEACEEVIAEKRRSCSSCLWHKSLYIRVQQFSRHPQPCSGTGGKDDDVKSHSWNGRHPRPFNKFSDHKSRLQLMLDVKQPAWKEKFEFHYQYNFKDHSMEKINSITWFING